MRSFTSCFKVMGENEIHTLREAITALTRSVDGLTIRFDERSKTIDKDLNDAAEEFKVLSNEVWGTGDSNPGIKAKVLEHSLAIYILKSLTAILATATIGLLVQIFWGVIKSQ